MAKYIFLSLVKLVYKVYKLIKCFKWFLVHPISVEQGLWRKNKDNYKFKKENKLKWLTFIINEMKASANVEKFLFTLGDGKVVLYNLLKHLTIHRFINTFSARCFE